MKVHKKGLIVNGGIREREWKEEFTDLSEQPLILIYVNRTRGWVRIPTGPEIRQEQIKEKN